MKLTSKQTDIEMEVPAWVLPFKPGARIRHELFANRLYDYPARYWGGRTAVTDGTKSYTFRELYDLSISLADVLMRRGIRKSDRIIVLAEKCSQMAVIVPAIWRAGAVYVPIDPLNPGSRNAYLFESIRPALIIAPFGAYEKYELGDAPCPVVSFDGLLEVPSDADEENAGFPDIEGIDLAYIMHTSGSTGIPKGVMIEHGSLTDYFYNHNLVLRFTETSYCLSNAPFYFDVSIEDTFLPLSTGASVYQYRGLPISSLILNLMSREGITHLIAVSTLLALITGDGKRLAATALGRLEMVMTGAEVCDVKVINTWKRLLPHVRVLNVYGPTEATIVCTSYTIGAADADRSGFYPIGKALENVTALLFDDSMEVISEPNRNGMLYIGGRQVMRGYWDDSALTQKVIMDRQGKRFYRTGDICYWDENGDLVFYGRNDDEVKLLGRRINLLEVRNRLLGNPFIKTAAVGVVTVHSRKALAAVITMDEDTDISEAAGVRSYLRDRLPAYMIPEFFAIKHTPSLSKTGKHDEKMILVLFEQVLQTKTDNFFLLEDDREFTALSI